MRVPAEASYVVLFERRPRRRATWTTDGGPELLDRDGAEIVLVGIDSDTERDHGIEAPPGPGASHSNCRSDLANAAGDE